MSETPSYRFGDCGGASPTWLTKEEAAEFLRVRPRTIDRWVAEGIIMKYRIADLQSVRFNKEELETLVQPVQTGE